jgi:hypothetical protein
MLLRRRFGWSEESTRDPSSFAARGTHVGSRAAAELRRDPPALTLLRRQNAVRTFVQQQKLASRPSCPF